MGAWGKVKTIMGVVSGVLGVLGGLYSLHDMAMTAAGAPSTVPVVHGAQVFLAGKSNGGTAYTADLVGDTKVIGSIRTLFNENEKFAGSFITYYPPARDWFKCPFIKQYRQFVLGEDGPVWYSDAAFVKVGQYPNSDSFFKTVTDSDIDECTKQWTSSREILPTRATKPQN